MCRMSRVKWVIGNVAGAYFTGKQPGHFSDFLDGEEGAHYLSQTRDRAHTAPGFAAISRFAPHRNAESRARNAESRERHTS